jgi:hypothetical protein
LQPLRVGERTAANPSERRVQPLQPLQPDVRRFARAGQKPLVTDVPGEDSVPFPETPKLVEARIASHPSGGRDCLLATTEDGKRWRSASRPRAMTGPSDRRSAAVARGSE